MANEIIKDTVVGIQNSSDKILIYGNACVGKSTSIATAAASLQDDAKLVYLMTENNAAGGFEFGLKHYNVPIKENQVIYSIIKPPTKIEGESVSDFGNLLRATKSQQTEKQAVKHDPNDQKSNKDKYGFLIKILESCASFTGLDYVSGKQVRIGNVGNLTYKDILVIDGLSNIAHEVWKVLYGDALVLHQYDYQPAQQYLFSIFQALENLTCNVILLSHEKEYGKPDPTSTVRPPPQVLDFYGPDTKVGNANFQSLMGKWGYVIRAHKQGTRYYWTGEEDKVFTAKREKLVVEEKQKWNQLQPDFRNYGFFK